MAVLGEFAALWPPAWQEVKLSAGIGAQRTPAH